MVRVILPFSKVFYPLQGLNLTFVFNMEVIPQEFIPLVGASFTGRESAS
jgi:hypothetical protein